jgi:xanthine dehydrogenase accessory factor
MDSVDLEVLKTAQAWVQAGQRCQLVTVIKTWGSSPRPIGAMLAICEDGTVVGSVSGGCIEDDLIARVREHGIERALPEVVTYGITADEAHRFGLPCGGTIELAIEPLSQSSAIAELLARLDRHELLVRRLEQARHAKAASLTPSTAPAGACSSLAPASCRASWPRWPAPWIITSPSATRARNTAPNGSCPACSSCT